MCEYMCILFQLSDPAHQCSKPLQLIIVTLPWQQSFGKLPDIGLIFSKLMCDSAQNNVSFQACWCDGGAVVVVVSGAGSFPPS
jgi:hypothetical protein